MTALYRLIYFIVVHLLLPWLHPISDKVSRGYQLRKKQNGIFPWLLAPQNERPVWIHCASGEFEYALPLIREIKKQNPQQKIMVTYYTPSYVQKIKAEPLVDYVFPSPWDEPSTMKQFIAHHQPKALLFARTDVWFEMTHQCHLSQIPVVVFSMTYHKKTNLMLRAFFRWRWQYVNQFFVVSEDDQKQLLDVLPSATIEVLGDSRYDQCLYRLAQNKKIPFQIKPSTQKLMVAGSTWPEDEDVLIPVIQKTRYRLRWIVVPHESTAEHLYSLSEKLKAAKIRFAFSSQTQEWNSHSVLVVDQVGFLAELYKDADMSFIGGSFRKQVHSVMESLACGVLTFVGPFYKNNREAIEFSQISPQAVRPVQSSEDLLENLEAGFSTWTSQEKSDLKKKIEAKSGVAQKLMKRMKL